MCMRIILMAHNIILQDGVVFAPCYLTDIVILNSVLNDTLNEHTGLNLT